MAARYGYEDGMLVQVISATDNALGQMRSLNSQVVGLSGQLPMVNNSTSGMKLGQLLSEWTTDYAKIVAQLEELNGRATGLLNVNRSAEADAASAPR